MGRMKGLIDEMGRKGRWAGREMGRTDEMRDETRVVYG